MGRLPRSAALSTRQRPQSVGTVKLVHQNRTSPTVTSTCIWWANRVLTATKASAASFTTTQQTITRWRLIPCIITTLGSTHAACVFRNLNCPLSWLWFTRLTQTKVSWSIWISKVCIAKVSEWVEFNAPPDTIYVISEAEMHSKTRELWVGLMLVVLRLFL